MFDKFVLPELVGIAQHILETKGESGIINYEAGASWCGCMGPKPGERLCPCEQRQTLKSNMIEVVAEFDEPLARRVMLSRLVAALPG